MGSWDYSLQAKSYASRPNYAPQAIGELCAWVGASRGGTIVADVGAGTANLTVMLQERVKKVFAIEPTGAMAEIGGRRTAANVEWLGGTGECTGLPDASVHWAAFGSSFNTTDRPAALAESHRILKPGGFFSCMWNHRDLDDPVQKRVEEAVKRVIPGYARGTRREPQADVIIASRLFNDVHYIEADQMVGMDVERFIDGWRSVRNSYWDLTTPGGRDTFDAVVREVRRELSEFPRFSVRYTTRIWTAKRI